MQMQGPIPHRPLTRRTFLGASAIAALTGCTRSADRATPSPSATAATPSATLLECLGLDGTGAGDALWQAAMRQGIVFGSSTATWQLSDGEYRRLFAREAAILFTEDDLLWYRLKPTPDAPLDFTYGDRAIGFAEREGMLVLGAHLVWDEGFGDGWKESDLWGMDEATAREVLFGTVERTVGRYRGRVAAWIVANEVLDGAGLRTDVPWYAAIGPGYVAEGFRVAAEADPGALLLLNDFGFETDDDFALAADKRAATLRLLDELMADGVPVHALGVQAHLQAGTFEEAFDAAAYRRFLTEVADRGLEILITEMDVLDDGLPPAIGPRDRAVADTARRYLDVALDEPAVSTLVIFGLSDRYTWLEEDFPRRDGAARRPLPFDDRLRPKPLHAAVHESLADAHPRAPVRLPPRC